MNPNLIILFVVVAILATLIFVSDKPIYEGHGGGGGGGGHGGGGGGGHGGWHGGHGGWHGGRAGWGNYGYGGSWWPYPYVYDSPCVCDDGTTSNYNVYGNCIC